MSRRTWERRGKPMVAAVASMPPTAVASSVASPAASPVASMRVTQVAPVTQVKPLRLIESRLGPGRCAQCNGLRDGQEVERVIHNARVLLHRECLRFYTSSHDAQHADLWRWPWYGRP